MELFQYAIKSSYGNDSAALIQWAFEHALEDVVVIYNDTGWSERSWNNRVSALESWVIGLGFTPHRTKSIGLEQLVRNKKSWPRQGMQFCTAELKIKPTLEYLDRIDPRKLIVVLIGVRREESVNRRNFPEYQPAAEAGRDIWAPLVGYSSRQRDELLDRACVESLPHRSEECYPCINANRTDIRRLTKERVYQIAGIETSLGVTSKGSPRTMFRPYKHMGATGIQEIARWAWSERGEFDLDDGNGISGCEAGYCGI
jgi:Phosphoadenosine phosphosulfate reductase family